MDVQRFFDDFADVRRRLPLAAAVRFCPRDRRADPLLSALRPLLRFFALALDGFCAARAPPSGFLLAPRCFADDFALDRRWPPRAVCSPSSSPSLVLSPFPQISPLTPLMIRLIVGWPSASLRACIWPPSSCSRSWPSCSSTFGNISPSSSCTWCSTLSC